MNNNKKFKSLVQRLVLVIERFNASRRFTWDERESQRVFKGKQSESRERRAVSRDSHGILKYHAFYMTPLLPLKL